MENQMEKLKNVFGFNNYEARLYWAALNFETASISDLAKRAKIPRTAAYRHILNMVDKGFLLIIKIGKRKLFQALRPDQLKHILNRKMVILEEVTDDLVKRISAPEKKLAISYYSGIEGVQIACDIWLENAKTKLGKSFENVESTILQHGKKQVAYYQNKRISRRIMGRMIVSGSPDSLLLKEVLKKDKEELRESVIVSPRTYSIPATFAVLDDMVVIYTTEENPFAVLIKNQDVADSLDSIHDMVWDRYKR